MSSIPSQSPITPISFPPEIWLDILVVLRSSLTEEEETRKHKTIDNIVLVSRSYRDLIQPLLFETITITIKRGYWSDWLVPRLEGLATLFDTQPQAARWIKSLVILRRGSARLKREEAALLEQVFLRMTNIRALHVSNLNVTQAMYAHICQLPALGDVNIEPIGRNSSLDGSLLSFGDLRIRRVRLGGKSLTNEAATTALMQLILSPYLQQLEVGAQYLAGFAWSLCTIYPKHSFSGLTSMTTAPPGSHHINSFFHFLASCPNITELQLQFPYSDYSVHEEGHLEGVLVTPNIFPRLSTLYSSKSFAKLLVPGRPITDLQLTSPQELSLDDLRVLSTGSKEILRLCFGLLWIDFPDLLNSIADLFPRLRSLEVLCHGIVSSTKDSFTQDIVRLRDLKRLYLGHGFRTGMGFTRGPLVEQKQALDSIRAGQSSLKEVCFDSNQTWWWTDGGGWKLHDANEVEEDYNLDEAFCL